VNTLLEPIDCIRCKAQETKFGAATGAVNRQVNQQGYRKALACANLCGMRLLITVSALGLVSTALLMRAATTPEPKLVSELRLSSVAPGDTDKVKSARVTKGLAYSPDGKWIAVMAGGAGVCRKDNDVLFLVPASGNLDGVKRIGLNHCTELDGWNQAARPIEWSPDSEHIAVSFTSPRDANGEAGHFAIVRASDGAQKELSAPDVHPAFFWPDHERSGFSGFLDGDRMLMVSKSKRHEGPGDDFDVTLSICDLNGQKLSERTLLVDFGLALAFGPPAMVYVLPSDQPKPVISDPVTGKVLSKGPRLPGYNPEVHFGDAGKIVCTATEASDARSNRMICFDIPSGVEILPKPSVRNGTPFELARNSSVLLASDVYCCTNPNVDEPPIRVSRVIWDLRSGKELARMRFQMQSQKSSTGLLSVGGGGVEYNVESTGVLAPAALSPEGERVAYGCNDLLRIYQIPK
jgi:hypothetical protein